LNKNVTNNMPGHECIRLTLTCQAHDRLETHQIAAVMLCLQEK